MKKKRKEKYRKKETKFDEMKEYMFFGTESTRNVLCVGGKKSVKIRTGFKKNPLNGFK